MHLQETSKKQKRLPALKQSDGAQSKPVARAKRRERAAARAARLRFRKSQNESDDVANGSVNVRGAKNYSRGTIRNMCEAQADPKKPTVRQGKDAMGCK